MSTGDKLIRVGAVLVLLCVLGILAGGVVGCAGACAGGPGAYGSVSSALSRESLIIGVSLVFGLAGAAVYFVGRRLNRP